MLDDGIILKETAALHDYLIDTRRRLHTIAETGGQENDTRALIEQQLKEDGVPFVELTGTSLVATIATDRQGPAILLRTDMDALPMKEEPDNLKGPRICESRTPERTCHACGHDAHMAMCLTAVKILARHQDQLTGTIDIVFESGEENGAGFPHVMDYLKDRTYDAIWAIHVYAGMPAGKLCVQAGPRMAGGAAIDVIFKGKGGHGSRPDQAINPVFCAANFVNNMAVAFANQIDANQTVTLGVTGIIGGTVGNVIPDDAHVIGTMRFFDADEGHKAVRILHETAEHTAAMHHCTVAYGPMASFFGIPTTNDAHCAAVAEQALTEILPAGTVTKWEPWYASESYSLYLQKWPGVMCHLGIRNEDKGTGAPHHNGFFDVDEDALPLGCIATLKYVAAIQAEGSHEKGKADA